MNVVLCGLEGPLTESLSRFANVSHVRNATWIPDSFAFMERLDAGAILCGADPRHYCALLNAPKRRSLKPAVVVARRLP
jgi:hypothetical protein